MHSPGEEPESSVRAMGATLEAAMTASGAPRATQESVVAATILVVDDDDPVRIMLARLLRTQGYDVLQAAHANEARALLDDHRPDLVISDIVMPGESGIELRRSILERWPEIPVILISGYSAEGPAEFAARTTKTVFVQKPFAADQFLALVEQTLLESERS
jgi:DNA-binding NtrC family response regulator